VASFPNCISLIVSADDPMKTTKTIAVASLFLMLLAPLTPAFGVSKEIVQLQTQVQILSDQLQKMQQSNDERMGVLKNLIETNTDSVNKMTAALAAMQKTLQSQNGDTQAKVDQISGQVQALNDSVDEMKARLNKLQKQLEDIQTAQQNMAAQAVPATAATSQQPTAVAQPQAPPADVLYANALRDYNAARYDLAVQQFTDYLKFYSNTDLAGNAQFYIADVEYRQGNFDAAVADYDKVLEQFPGGNKAAASQLKKGFALLELGQKDAGVRELNSLINRYPKALEAQQARDRLRKLGIVPGAKPSATKKH
jgi:tol-pal system protein YbgF